MRFLLYTIFMVSSLLAFGFVDQEVKIVPVEKAYKPNLQVQKDKIKITVEMAPKVYLYQKYFKLTEIEPEKKEIDIKKYLPKPIELHGEKVYEGNLTIAIPIQEFGTGNIKVEFDYQGCNEVGICYPPQKKIFTFSIPDTSQEKTKKSEELSEELSITQTLKTQSIGVILATFFGFGFLLALTPCVFPMFPILSSLIVGAKNMNTKKAFLYSVVYVLAMSIAYTIAGVLAGLFGANLQAALQNPVAIVLFAAVFVALALSMFGFYEIGLPASWQTKIAQKSDEASHKGGLIGVAIMGFLSALIVGPCVAPPLAGALIYIGQTGDAMLGGAALFFMSLGMGMPLILVGTGAGKFMPKPGGWMQAVNAVFGVVMLGVAIWMLSRILPDSISLFLWAMLFIGSAVYMRTLEGIEKDAHWFVYLKKSVGIVFFVYGIFLMIGSFTGASNPLDPLKVLKTKGAITEVSTLQKPLFQEVQSFDEFQKLLKNSDKPVMLDFTAKWCASCQELEEITFADPKVQAALRKEFLALRLDVSDNSKEDKAFMKRFGIFGPPAILFFDKNGKEIRSLRIVGFKNPKEFLSILEEVKRRYR
ncbi:protein-disulfide reductase DsbD [Nitratiruptor sp. SB155-2]|uniref:protein-disulfide reductase DsbD n=1 Tax=Nitratiruptor sp. (strain SB155-2) TaxID=387092 RepID=UPI0001586FCD|nr:protein-disulfide reductase DsbD [Nitratiruptor sp. SB155-2]BAF70225.1 thiol:disulfide interchange protein DsbD [Nitratiruptor sp. SB155-2]